MKLRKHLNSSSARAARPLCAQPLGRATARVAPSSDRAAIETALAEAAEGIEYLRAASQPQTAIARRRHSLVSICADPAAAVGRLRIEGATLEATEIFELTRLLDLAAEARRSCFRRASDSRVWRRTARRSPICANWRTSCAARFCRTACWRTTRASTLGRLRRDIEKQRRQIQHSLERFLRAHHEDGTLQEDFVTIRNDRFVVPVVTGRERRVDGVIHGASGSGHTVFVEPLETIELNNELVRLHEEELREVHRLLREFTARLREHAAEIAASVEALSRLELIFAKAEFAAEFHCSVPRLSPEGSRRSSCAVRGIHCSKISCANQKKTVVPVTFELDATQRTLLISGPNTGGKTVALKTIGLLALMAHAGLPVPADDAEFPLFDEVLADIGDHQSIDESLSTFSAHIVAIRSMLERATGIRWFWSTNWAAPRIPKKAGRWAWRCSTPSARAARLRWRPHICWR